jgi:oxygen-independent coproporphyrinogen-3 oxidase
VRRWNAGAFEPWLAALGAGRLPPGGSETVEPDGAAAEALILSLRLQTGVAEDDADGARRPAIEWGIESGLVERNAGRLRLTLRGRLLSNELFGRLL